MQLYTSKQLSANGGKSESRIYSYLLRHFEYIDMKLVGPCEIHSKCYTYDRFHVCRCMRL
jgi:hypothetical protein